MNLSDWLQDVAEDSRIDGIADAIWERDHAGWDGKCNDSECPCWADDDDAEWDDTDLFDDDRVGDDHDDNWDDAGRNIHTDWD